MRPCFRFTAHAADKLAVLALDEEIGFWGTQAKDFRAALDAVDGHELHVEINSIGGDVFAGLGMYNMLRTWAARDGNTVTTRVTGLAASIASVIALAGDKREMPKNSFAMVHQASSGVWGTADDMREAADTLDKIDASIRSIYVDRMGVDEAKATEIMAKDTWLTAEECLSLGFATDLTDSVEATAKYDIERAELPENVRAVFKAQASEPPPANGGTEPPAGQSDAQPAESIVEQITARAKAAGLEPHAKVIALACTTLAEADQRIARARDIVAMCKIAGRPDDAAKAIKKDTPVAEVRAALVRAQADADENIDGTPPEPAGRTPNHSTDMVDTTAVWKKHHERKAQNRAKGR